MITQGWTRIARIITLFALAVLLSGCHAVPVGAPHPFTTMFEYEHPPQPQSLTLRAEDLFEAEAPDTQTTWQNVESVY